MARHWLPTGYQKATPKRANLAELASGSPCFLDVPLLPGARTGRGSLELPNHNYFMVQYGFDLEMAPTRTCARFDLLSSYKQARVFCPDVPR